MIHAVSCAAGWPDGDEDGPVVVIDDTLPYRVCIDGDPLRVAQWTWSPEREFQNKGHTFHHPAEIAARLPMENGAVLDVSWPQGTIVTMSLGRDDNRQGWIPLREEALALTLTHGDCFGDECSDPCCVSVILDDPTVDFSWSPSQIVDAWRRIGTKPIDLSDPPKFLRPSFTKLHRSPRAVSELDKIIRSGRTVTLEEWQKLNG